MKIRKRLAAALVFCIFFLSGCGQEKNELILVRENAFTLADGTGVDRWEPQYGGYAIYKLSDGTELLQEMDYIHVENVSVAGSAGYDQLNETAQAAVSAYYDALPPFYDLAEQLELAYGEYMRKSELGEPYFTRFLSQEEYPTAANEKIICFRVEAHIPKGDQVSYQLWENAIFDRETGEKMEVWDLFTVPEAQARKYLLDLMAADDPTLYREMEAALKPEYITLWQGVLEILFPEGTLPSQTYATGGGFDIGQVAGILHDWAVIEENES